MRLHTYFRTCICEPTKMSAHTNSLQIRYDQNEFELRGHTLITLARFWHFFQVFHLKYIHTKMWIEYLVLKSYVLFQKDVDPKVLQRAGQKGWKKVHYWLHVVCSQSSHRMNAKYYYYNVATLLLHRRWSLDRRSFSSSTPPALESRVDISKAHWGQKRFKVALNFCGQGDSIIGHWQILPCLSNLPSSAWTFSTLKRGQNKTWTSYLPCLVIMVLINPHP